MKTIGICDCDNTSFPNLALMKISAWHKKRGDCVEFFSPLNSAFYDQIYASKVFRFTKNNPYLFGDFIAGGIGFNDNVLADEIEHIMPDYALYGVDYAMGFVTRGCPNKCSWCVVPSKEGEIRANAEIEEFHSVQKKIILLDNNILAHEHGIKELEKIADRKIILDCNQGLDARLVDNDVAKLLAKIKFEKIRFACDSSSQMQPVKDAIEKIRKFSGKKGNFFIYVLVKDVDDALVRVEFLRSIGADPFAQPYRDLNNHAEPPKILKRFARWVNHKAIFKSVKWSDYR